MSVVLNLNALKTKTKTHRHAGGWKLEALRGCQLLLRRQLLVALHGCLLLGILPLPFPL